MAETFLAKVLAQGRVTVPKLVLAAIKAKEGTKVRITIEVI